MPTNLVPVDTFSLPVTVPQDTDAAVVSSVNGAFQSLADQSEFLRSRIISGKTASRYYASLTACVDVSAAWGMVAGGAGYVRRQSDTSGARELRFHIPLPTMKGTLVKLVARVDGGGGHAGLPGTMPSLAATIGFTFVGGAAGTLYTASDTSGSAGAYDVPHDIELSLGGAAFSGTASLWVQFFGETGVNALNDKLQIGSLYVEIDP